MIVVFAEIGGLDVHLFGIWSREQVLSVAKYRSGRLEGRAYLKDFEKSSSIIFASHHLIGSRTDSK